MAAERGATTTRCRVVYQGYVQGVCFRANTLEIARRCPVVGYVHNLPDGTVELEAQGQVADVETFLNAVAARFARNISLMTRTDQPLRSDEDRFEIRY